MVIVQVAILANGKLRAFGTPLFLKNRFGAGYQVKLLAQPNKLGALQTLVADFLPGSELVASEASNLTIGLPKDCSQHVPVFLRQLQDRPDLVREFGISGSSLEEVFLRLVAAGHTVTEIREGGDNSNAAGGAGGASRFTGADGIKPQPPPMCSICGRRRTANVTLYTAGGIAVHVAGVTCQRCAVRPAGATSDDDGSVASAEAESKQQVDATASPALAGSSPGEPQAQQHVDAAVASAGDQDTGATELSPGDVALTPPSSAENTGHAMTESPSLATRDAASLDATHAFALTHAPPDPATQRQSLNVSSGVEESHTSAHAQHMRSSLKPVSVWTQASALVRLRFAVEAKQRKTNCCRCCCVCCSALLVIIFGLAAGAGGGAAANTDGYILCPPGFYVRSGSQALCDKASFVDSFLQASESFSLGTQSCSQSQAENGTSSEACWRANWKHTSVTSCVGFLCSIPRVFFKVCASIESCAVSTLN